MFCPVCGTLNEDTVAFCGGCGGPLVPQQPAPQQPVCQQPVYQQPVYQQPVYQQPAYQPQPMPAYPYWMPPQPVVQPPVPGKGLGIASLILGIASLVLGAVWFVSGICAVLAIIFGAVALGKAKQVGRGNGMAIGGVICGAVGLAVAVLFGMAVIEIWSAISGELTDVGMDFTQSM